MPIDSIYRVLNDFEHFIGSKSLDYLNMDDLTFHSLTSFQLIQFPISIFLSKMRNFKKLKWMVKTKRDEHVKQDNLFFIQNSHLWREIQCFLEHIDKRRISSDVKNNVNLSIRHMESINDQRLGSVADMLLSDRPTNYGKRMELFTRIQSENSEFIRTIQRANHYNKRLRAHQSYSKKELDDGNQPFNRFVNIVLEMELDFGKFLSTFPKIRGRRIVRMADYIFIVDKNLRLEGYLTKTTVSRYTEFMIGLSNLFLHSLTEGPKRLVEITFDLLDEATMMAETNPWSVGEMFKAARNYSVASLDNDPIYDRRPEEMLMDYYSPKKRSQAKKLYRKVKRKVKDKALIPQVFNLYKFFPHPDWDPKEAFKELEGLRDSQTIEMKSADDFEAMLRKKICASLVKMGQNVKAFSDDNPNHPIVSLLSGSSLSHQKVMSYHWGDFSNMTFRRLESLTPSEDIILKPNDKSSCPDLNETIEEFQKMEGLSSETINPYVSDGKSVAKPVNDIIDEFKNGKAKNKDALRWFRRAVEKYEEFEEKHIAMGTHQDSISMEDHSKFLDDNKWIINYTATEPKLSEKHKSNLPRTFYMSERRGKGKIITQISERVCRQLLKGTTGISISKSFRQRIRDLEIVCSMLNAKTEGRFPIAISFDLSKFSRFFPMELMRRYGKILYELTGDHALRRPDILFRISVVVNLSRGYFGSVDAVKGGFEGFYNFIWSLIHATVMEGAMRKTGIVGHLLTFSDDGLLVLNAKVDDEEKKKIAVQTAIESIQKEYSDLGLIFHIGKTIVSFNTAEYLGDIFFNGHVLNFSQNQVQKIGLEDVDQSFTPFYESIKTISAQSRAYVSSGGNPVISSFLQTFYSFSRFNRIFPNTNHKVMRTLFVLPTSAGGLRIPNTFELSSSSGLSGFSHFMQDFFLLNNSEYGRAVSELIMKVAKFERPKKHGLLSALLNGQYFKTSSRDISGVSLCNRMIDEISEDMSGLVSNPISKTLRSKLEMVFKNTKKIDIRIFSLLIQATPQWADYNNSRKLVMSRSIRRLLGRKKIRRYQIRDYVSIKNRISELLSLDYDRKVPTYDKDVPNPETNYLYRQLVFGNMRPYDVAEPQFGPLMVIQPSSRGDPHITVTSRGLKMLNFHEPYFLQPKATMVSKNDGMKWLSNVSDPIISGFSKIAKVVMKIVSSHPTMSPAVDFICNHFEIKLPTLPKGLHSSIRRVRETAGKNFDFQYASHFYFMSTSNARLNYSFANHLDSKVKVDRTTYIQSTKLLSFISCKLQHFSRRMNKEIIINKFDVYYPDSFVYSEMRLNPEFKNEMKRFPLVDTKDMKLPDFVLRSYYASVLDEAKSEAYRYYATMNDLEKISKDQPDSDVLYDIASDKISKWIISFNTDGGSIIDKVMYDIPNSLMINSEILRRSLVKVCNHICKQRLSEMQYSVLSDRVHVQKDIRENKMSTFSKDDSIRREDFKIISAVISEARNSTLNFVSEIESPFVNDHIIDTIIYNETFLEEVFDNDDDVSFLEGKLKVPDMPYSKEKWETKPGCTQKMVTLYSKRFKKILAHLLNVGFKSKWRPEAIKKNFLVRNPGIIDESIDLLNVAISVLRPSTHRTNPYNVRMFQVVLLPITLIDVYVKSNRVRLDGLLHLRNLLKQPITTNTLLHYNSMQYLDRKFPIDSENLANIDVQSRLTMPIDRRVQNRMKSKIKYAIQSYCYKHKIKLFNDMKETKEDLKDSLTWVKRNVGNRVSDAFKRIPSLQTFFYMTFVKPVQQSLKSYDPSFIKSMNMFSASYTHHSNYDFYIKRNMKSKIRNFSAKVPLMSVSARGIKVLFTLLCESMMDNNDSFIDYSSRSFEHEDHRFPDLLHQSGMLERGSKQRVGYFDEKCSYKVGVYNCATSADTVHLRVSMATRYKARTMLITTGPDKFFVLFCYKSNGFYPNSSTPDYDGKMIIHDDDNKMGNFPLPQNSFTNETSMLYTKNILRKIGIEHLVHLDFYEKPDKMKMPINPKASQALTTRSTFFGKMAVTIDEIPPGKDPIILIKEISRSGRFSINTVFIMIALVISLSRDIDLDDNDQSSEFYRDIMRMGKVFKDAWASGDRNKRERIIYNISCCLVFLNSHRFPDFTGMGIHLSRMTKLAMIFPFSVNAEISLYFPGRVKSVEEASMDLFEENLKIGDVISGDKSLSGILFESNIQDTKLFIKEYDDNDVKSFFDDPMAFLDSNKSLVASDMKSIDAIDRKEQKSSYDGKAQDIKLYDSFGFEDDGWDDDEVDGDDQDESQSSSEDDDDDDDDSDTLYSQWN